MPVHAYANKKFSIPRGARAAGRALPLSLVLNPGAAAPKGCEGTLHSCSLFFMGCDSVVPMADSSLMDGTCQGCCEKPSPLLLCCLLDNLSLGMDVAIPFVICEMNREGCPEKEQEIGWNMQATSLELCVL